MEFKEWWKRECEKHPGAFNVADEMNAKMIWDEARANSAQLPFSKIASIADRVEWVVRESGHLLPFEHDKELRICVQQLRKT